MSLLAHISWVPLEELLSLASGGGPLWFAFSAAFLRRRRDTPAHRTRTRRPEMNLPQVVSPAEWDVARERLLAKEKGGDPRPRRAGRRASEAPDSPV
jgi:hypothetical protein